MRKLVLLLLVITVLPANAWRGDDVRKMFTGATIDNYGPMPSAGSGVLMVLRVAHGKTAAGKEHDFYFVHAGDDQFLSNSGAHAYPTPGTRCDLVTVTHHVSSSPSSMQTGGGGPQDPIGDVIEEIRC